MDIEKYPEIMRERGFIDGWTITVNENEPEYKLIMDTKYDVFLNHNMGEAEGVKFVQMLVGFDFHREPQPMPLDDEDLTDVYEECVVACLEDKLYEARKQLKMAHVTIKGMTEDLNECTAKVYILQKENERLKAKLTERGASDE